MIDLTIFNGITPGPWRVRQGHGLLFVDAPECRIDNGRGMNYATQILADEGYDTKEADCVAVASLPQLVKETRELRRLVLAWWKEHEHDEAPDGGGGFPHNVYDEPPEFVKAALAIQDSTS